MPLRTCPICGSEGVDLPRRLALPLTGQLRCSKCQCQLRRVKGTLRGELMSWGVWLLLLLSMTSAVLFASPLIFAVGILCWIAIELLVPLELDLRDAPSVRRASRFGA